MTNDFADSTLTIDLAAIAENYNIIKKKLKSKTQCAAVIKADAYGLGVEKVAKSLLEAGCEKFFVANIDEAIKLRQILEGAYIYVFHGVGEGQESLCLEYRLVPVLNCFHSVYRWIQFEESLNHALPCVIHIDTGMNRLGLSEDEVKKILDHDVLDKLNIQYIMSHLACADNEDHELNQIQLDKIKEFSEMFKGIPVSLSNSYGVFLNKDFHFDLARPGVSLFGVNPTPLVENPMKNVISLESKILQIRAIDRKSSIGYGASYSLEKGARVAVLPVGYADGYLRSLGNNSYLMFKGKKLPLVGRVSMDLITVDISSLDEYEIEIGDKIELIGDDIAIDDLASYAGTIGYEILTSLGGRYKRIYK